MTQTNIKRTDISSKILRKIVRESKQFDTILSSYFTLNNKTQLYSNFNIMKSMQSEYSSYINDFGYSMSLGMKYQLNDNTSLSLGITVMKPIIENSNNHSQPKNAIGGYEKYRVLSLKMKMMMDRLAAWPVGCIGKIDEHRENR